MVDSVIGRAAGARCRALGRPKAPHSCAAAALLRAAAPPRPAPRLSPRPRPTRHPALPPVAAMELRNRVVPPSPEMANKTLARTPAKGGAGAKALAPAGSGDLDEIADVPFDQLCHDGRALSPKNLLIKLWRYTIVPTKVRVALHGGCMAAAWVHGRRMGAWQCWHSCCMALIG